ncbi:10456_t:CDS:2 [Funneliformis mosseae]|uniref:10456_t:CDS:1 n=1 Tax=Funneliformis mosseae TaxID=27381 RepID=A0A9N9C3J3_FUNMO|nr:10456_t:CDS:2 [Funneliformis mosseae]
MDYLLDPVDFGIKYSKDYPKATGKEARAKYEEYNDFYTTYHQDNPERSNRKKNLNIVTSFVLYCKLE